MIEQSTLIRLAAGRVRVLRVIASGPRCWPFQYDVEPSERMCRFCGCTTIYGCAGGCAWVRLDLCSRCFTKEILR